jgi:hypothetical protein
VAGLPRQQERLHGALLLLWPAASDNPWPRPKWDAQLSYLIALRQRKVLAPGISKK